MEDDIETNNQIQVNQNIIEFNPGVQPEDEDISIEFQDFELDEETIVSEVENYKGNDEFMNYKEYMEIFDEYLEIKKSNIKEAYSNSLYFIKKIISFYNKETFFDCYFLTLKCPPQIKNEKSEKFISFNTQIDKEKIYLNFDKESKIINYKITPDNLQFQISLNINKNSIHFPISNIDEAKKQITIIYGSKRKSNITFDNVNTKIFDNILNKNLSDNIVLNANSLNENIEQNGNNSFANENTIESKETSSNDLSSSRSNTFLSINDENLNIVTKEINDNIFNIINKEKIGGKNFKIIANQTFELMCNIVLNRNITVKNYKSKNPDKINSFFKLEGKNKINTFQIDLYIQKLNGKELNKIYNKYPKNFLWFENLCINEKDNYEIIGEVSNNIINNARQKISQQFNYIHLIKEFNNYKYKKNDKFISLCKLYDLNNLEKIFILFTDGSYIKIKYIFNIINKYSKEIESLINNQNDIKDLLNKLKEYIPGNDANILNIDIEKFKNFFIFYNNLKCSGIKFCFCFISDIIEDKLENKIEEDIKYYLDNNKDMIQIIQENSIDKEDKENNPNKDKKFILEIYEHIKKNNRLKLGMMKITDELNKKIKEFVYNKNNTLKDLDVLFAQFQQKNSFNFSKMAGKILESTEEINLLAKKIYTNLLFLYFIFIVPCEYTIELSKIKEAIKNSGIECSYLIIQKEKMDEIEKEIKLKTPKNKIDVNIFISNDLVQVRFLKTYKEIGNNYVFYYSDNRIDIPILEIIKKTFISARKLFVTYFYKNNKYYFNVGKNKKEILLQHNLVKKIKYDLKLINMKSIDDFDCNCDNIFDILTFKFGEDDEIDKNLIKIGDNYFNSLIDMIKELLETAKIKKNNKIMDFFINKERFMEKFKSLIENIKCKCFYKDFWLKYVNNLIEFDKSIKIKNIELVNIIKKNK